MHIAIDIRALQTPGSRDRGLGYGLKGWLTEFLKLPYCHRVTLLTDPRFDLPELDVPLSGDFWKIAAFESHPVIMRLPDVQAEYQAYQNTECFLQAQKVDLFHIHSPFETALKVGYPSTTCRCVATFHDALPVLFPDDYLGGGKLYAAAYHTKLQALRYCDRIVAISQSAADDLVKFTEVPSDRVDVIYYAPSPDMFESPTAEEIAQSSWLPRIGGRYIFALLGDNPTKNVERLVAAFCQLPSHIRSEYKLVITYRIHESHKATVQSWLDKYHAGERVIFTGWVPAAELRVLYASAALYVHPALYEGFGMPIVEAMALGTPVIVSNTGPMPEIVGDAALTFDPYSGDAIANTIQRVLQDQGLREELGQRALVRVRDFTWQKAALAMRETYERALTGARPAMIVASVHESKGVSEAQLRELSDTAEVMDRSYTVKLKTPLVGGLGAWIRRNSTTHLREVYFDLMLEKQTLFNTGVARALHVAWRVINDDEQAGEAGAAEPYFPGSETSRRILMEAAQLAERQPVLNGFLLAGPLPEYGSYLGRDFYQRLHLASMISLPEVDGEQKIANARWIQTIHRLAWYVEEHRELQGMFWRMVDALNPDVMLRGYAVRSGAPVVGPAIAWFRRNLTFYLRESYVDPVLERQVAFNRLALQSIDNILGINPILLCHLGAAANILNNSYEGHSNKPIIGPLITAIRRDLTAHLKEPYIDPTFRRQVAFNNAVVDVLTGISAQIANLQLKEIYGAAPTIVDIGKISDLKNEIIASTASSKVKIAGQTAFVGLLLQLLDQMETRMRGRL
ncbi:MAG: glycosyltransferase family 4 protein [Anaerolineae bacterium]|nr:glycosyltransferase family 4 protein [Anaerolineae bacterium]